MVSPLALALLASLAADTPPDETGPPFSAALEQATYVVLAEIAETHDVAGETVEEATVTQVLKGSLGAGRIFYKADSCGCNTSSPTKAKEGSRVLLLLSPGSEVQERR